MNYPLSSETIRLTDKGKKELKKWIFATIFITGTLMATDEYIFKTEAMDIFKIEQLPSESPLEMIDAVEDIGFWFALAVVVGCVATILKPIKRFGWAVRHYEKIVEITKEEWDGIIAKQLEEHKNLKGWRKITG